MNYDRVFLDEDWIVDADMPDLKWVGYYNGCRCCSFTEPLEADKVSPHLEEMVKQHLKLAGHYSMLLGAVNALGSGSVRKLVQIAHSGDKTKLGIAMANAPARIPSSFFEYVTEMCNETP